MADDARIVLSATILPDEIQKRISGQVTTVTPENSSDKWFFGLINVTNSSADLIGGQYIAISTGTSTGSSPADVHTSDKVRFLFIKNTGTTDGSTATTEAIAICLDGGTASFSLGDCIEIGPGEAFYCKCPNTTVGNLHAVSIDSNMTGGGSSGEGNVQCIVAAIIDDVA
tara:strand:+ start:130 stop:639 length:510 start_codon:yes stop_codon:yes gene_type:complete